MSGSLSQAVIEGFWSRVDKRGDDECWPWTGSTSREGYGSAMINRVKILATRVSLTIAGRDRPSDQHFACHSCDNPICCNPAHLWWGTQSENIRDAISKRRFFNTRKTHCPRGHVLSGDNLIPWVPTRECRTCNNALRVARDIRYRAKRRAERVAK